MRQTFLCILLILSMLGLGVNEVAAKSFRMGKGFGAMRSGRMLTQASYAHRTTAPLKHSTTNRWRGALGGLLLGSVLTSLFMGHGLGSTLFSWFIVTMGIYLLVSFLNRKKQRD